MAQFIRANSDFGDAFSRTFAQSLHYAQQEAERKRQEEQNKAIAQMYLESMRAPADAAVAPYQANAIQSQDDAFRKQMVAESSAMTDSLMANNPNFTQRIQGQTAPVTPEQAPALQQQFQQTNQANLSQANNQAQSAEQMLAMAKEKYGTAMFDRLAPIVASGKVPAQAMISIIEKQVQTAEKTALKQAQNQAYKQAMELMKQGKFDEAKMLIAEYASPDAQGRLFASIGQGGMPPTISPGQGYFDKATGKYVVPIPKVEKPDNTVQWGPVQYDPQGRAYQVSNRNEIRPLANYDKPTKDTRLTELEKEEKREMDYLEKSAKPGQFATPDQLKTYQAQVKALQQKYQGLREGLKKPATTPQGEKPPMTMDMVLEAITKQGEDATRKKLASVYGEEEAERWVGRARNYR